MYVLVTQSCPTPCDSTVTKTTAPQSAGFSRQGYWSGWPFPPPGGGFHGDTPLGLSGPQATPDQLLLTGYFLSLPPGCALVGPVLAYQKGPEPLQPMTSEVSWLERVPNRSVLRGRPSPPRRQTLGRAPTLHSAAPVPIPVPAACQPGSSMEQLHLVPQDSGGEGRARERMRRMKEE